MMNHQSINFQMLKINILSQVYILKYELFHIPNYSGPKCWPPHLFLSHGSTLLILCCYNPYLTATSLAQIPAALSRSLYISLFGILLLLRMLSAITMICLPVSPSIHMSVYLPTYLSYVHVCAPCVGMHALRGQRCWIPGTRITGGCGLPRFAQIPERCFQGPCMWQWKQRKELLNSEQRKETPEQVSLPFVFGLVRVCSSIPAFNLCHHICYPDTCLSQLFQLPLAASAFIFLLSCNSDEPDKCTEI